MRKIYLLTFFHFIHFLFFIFLFNTAKATLTRKISSKGIKILNQTNFQSETGIYLNDFNRKLTRQADFLVMFYSDTCEYSKNFSRDIYVNLKNNTKQLNFNVILAALQCPSNRNICNQLHIQSYPELFYFPNNGGKYIYEKKTKTKENIIQFIKKSHNMSMNDKINKSQEKQFVSQKQKEENKENKENKEKQNQDEQTQVLYQTLNANHQQQDEVQQQSIQNLIQTIKEQKQSKQKIENKSQQQNKDIQSSLKLLKPSKNELPEQNYLLQSSHLKQKLLFFICGLLLICISLICISGLLYNIWKKCKKLTRIKEEKQFGQNRHIPTIQQNLEVSSQRIEINQQKYHENIENKKLLY